MTIWVDDERGVTWRRLRFGPWQVQDAEGKWHYAIRRGRLPLRRHRDLPPSYPVGPYGAGPYGAGPYGGVR